MNLIERINLWFENNQPDVYPEPRCPWTAIQRWGNRVQCVMDKGHSGLCVTEHTRRYRNDPWQIYKRRWRGINYDHGDGPGV